MTSAPTRNTTPSKQPLDLGMLMTVNDDELARSAYSDLARSVREMVGTKATLRAIQYRSGVNYTTVNKILKGGRSSRDNLIKLARAYNRNPNDLLELAGYERVPEFDLAAAQDARSATASARRLPGGGELVREAALDGIPPPEGYYDLPSEEQERARETFEIAVETALRRHRKHSSIGYARESQRGRQSGHTTSTTDT